MTDTFDEQDTTVRLTQGEPSKIIGGRACPTCGLKVSATTNVCPQDGTRLGQGSDGQPDIGLGNKYEFISTVGTGGMSVIYKAKQPLLHKVFAVKMLHSHILNEQTVQRFQQEAKTVATLKHPNVIAVHDFGLSEYGQPYMVMDFIDGPTLSELIQERGSLPLPEALDIFAQVCEALEHAHSHGVLHRDLKPGNIMLVKEESGYLVQLVDFGIAKIVDTDSSIAHQLTQTGEIFGSPLYMCPEQCMGKPVDQRGDIYALGCILYECLVGRPPHRGDSLIETIFKHLNEEPQSLKEARPDILIPPAVEDLVMKLLAIKPEDRYQNMSEVKEKLSAIQSGALKGGGIKVGKIQWRSALNNPTSLATIGTALAIVGLVSLCLSLITFKQTQEQEADRKEPLATPRQPAPSNKVPVERISHYNSLLDATPHSSLTDLVLADWLPKIGERNTLDLSKSPVTDAGLVSVAGLSGVQTLDLSETQITDAGVSSLAKLTSLKVLRLNGTKLTDKGLGDLAALPDLQELHLERTATDNNGLSAISHLPSLSILDIQSTNVTDDGMMFLTGMKTLKEIWLSGADVTDRGLATLAKMDLGAIKISDTKITGDGLKVISKVGSLYNVSASQLPIESKHLAALSSLSKLNYIELKHTRVTDDGLKYLTKLPVLTQIHLADSPVGDGAGKYLAQMKGLTHLNLIGTKITDALLSDISHLENLKYLNIDYDNVTDKGAEALTQLPNLIQVDASSTHISDAGLKSLSKMKTLRVVSVYGCSKITNHGVAWFKKNRPDCELRIWL